MCQQRRCQNTTFWELEHCLITCHGHGVSGLKGEGTDPEVPDAMGPSSLFLCRFVIVTATATVIRAGLRPPVTSQGWVVAWTAALCSLKVRPWGTMGRGCVVHLLRTQPRPVLPDQDTFLLAVIFSFLLPLLPGAGLAWCYYQQPGSWLQHCLCGSRRDPVCSG